MELAGGSRMNRKNMALKAGDRKIDGGKMLCNDLKWRRSSILLFRIFLSSIFLSKMSSIHPHSVTVVLDNPAVFS